MKNKNSDNSQIIKYSIILKGMKPSISSQNKKDATKKFKVTPCTICTYLNGMGKNLDVAEKLITFFTECIEIRQKKFEHMLKTLA